MQNAINVVAKADFFGWSDQAQKVFFCGLLLMTLFGVVPVRAQEGDLIKERISLAPGQKRNLEKYDAPGKDNKEENKSASKNDAPERSAGVTARNSSAKETANKGKNTDSESGSTPSAAASATAAPLSADVPPISYGTTRNKTASDPELKPITRGFTDFFTNPEKFLSDGMEYLIIAVFIFMVLLLLMNRFRTRVSES